MDGDEKREAICCNCTLQLHAVEYIECCECPVVLCVPCFRMGCELPGHERGHDYTVIEPGAQSHVDDRNVWGSAVETELLAAARVTSVGSWSELSSMLKGKISPRFLQEYFEEYFIRGPLGQFALQQFSWEKKRDSMIADGSLHKLYSDPAGDQALKLLLLREALMDSNETVDVYDKNFESHAAAIVQKHVENLFLNFDPLKANENAPKSTDHSMEASDDSCDESDAELKMVSDLDSEVIMEMMKMMATEKEDMPSSSNQQPLSLTETYNRTKSEILLKKSLERKLLKESSTPDLKPLTVYARHQMTRAESVMEKSPERNPLEEDMNINQRHARRKARAVSEAPMKKSSGRKPLSHSAVVPLPQRKTTRLRSPNPSDEEEEEMNITPRYALRKARAVSEAPMKMSSGRKPLSHSAVVPQSQRKTTRFRSPNPSDEEEEDMNINRRHARRKARAVSEAPMKKSSGRKPLSHSAVVPQSQRKTTRFRSPNPSDEEEEDMDITQRYALRKARAVSEAPMKNSSGRKPLSHSAVVPQSQRKTTRFRSPNPSDEEEEDMNINQRHARRKARAVSEAPMKKSSGRKPLETSADYSNTHESARRAEKDCGHDIVSYSNGGKITDDGVTVSAAAERNRRSRSTHSRKKPEAVAATRKQPRLPNDTVDAEQESRNLARRLFECRDVCSMTEMMKLREQAPKLSLFSSTSQPIELEKQTKEDLSFIFYNPYRDDFDVRWFDDAEKLISSLIIDLPPRRNRAMDMENEIKFALVEHYIRILQVRKTLHRGIMEHNKIPEFFKYLKEKTLTEAENSRKVSTTTPRAKKAVEVKDEDIDPRATLLKRMQQTLTRKELNEFVKVHEEVENLRERIAKLRVLQQQGVTSLAGFDKQKNCTSTSTTKRRKRALSVPAQNKNKRQAGQCWYAFKQQYLEDYKNTSDVTEHSEVSP